MPKEEWNVSPGFKEEFAEEWTAPPWARGGALGGVECSSLGPRRSLRRSGMLLLGLEEEP